ncbi:MAG: tetratricopeptide repeat protein [Prevotella sp.]|nr:tetratricopeptide repeat protein [Prevotella sp.]
MKKGYYTVVTRILMLTLMMVLAETSVAQGLKGLLKRKNPEAEAVERNTARRYQFFFLEAVSMEEKGKYAEAYDLFRHCLALNPNSAATYFKLSPYETRLGADTTALRYLEKAAALSPSNNNYQESLAQMYLNNGLYKQSIAAYEKVMETNHNRIDILQMLLRLYANQEDYDNIINTLNRMELIEGSSEQLSISKMRIYETQGNKEGALAELSALAAKHPNDLNYRVMVGNWLMNNGKSDSALVVFTDVLRIEPDNSMAQISMHDYYRQTGQKEQADELLHSLLMNEKTDEDTKMTLLRQTIAKSTLADSAAVVSLFHEVLAQPQESSQIAQMYAAYTIKTGMPEDSIRAALNGVLALEPDNFTARAELIQRSWNNKEYNNVAAECEQAVMYHPDRLVFYYFMGLAYYQIEDYEVGVRSLRRGAEQLTDESDPDMASDLYAMMGDMLHIEGMDVQAYEAYDSCLQWKPNHIGCLNNYAYYLSENDADLEKAERMSYQTIIEEPENATFLDTYAWILFKRERYAEAKEYIDKALSHLESDQNATIVEHAGDIYALNGEMDKAVEYWKRAIKEGGDAKILRKKINLRKYFKDENKKDDGSK